MRTNLPYVNGNVTNEGWGVSTEHKWGDEFVTLSVYKIHGRGGAQTAEMARKYRACGLMERPCVIQYGDAKGMRFPKGDEGKAACEALHEKEIDGRRLTVNEAKPQERRSGGYAGGGGGSSRGNGGGFGRPKREARW